MGLGMPQEKIREIVNITNTQEEALAILLGAQAPSEPPPMFVENPDLESLRAKTKF